jgi:hypothetical protein
MKNFKLLLLNAFLLVTSLVLADDLTNTSKCTTSNTDLCMDFDGTYGQPCRQCNTKNLGKCLPAGDNYMTCQTGSTPQASNF